MDKIFDNYLEENEELLWVAQPETNINFTNNDFLLIPLSIIWTLGIIKGMYDTVTASEINPLPILLIPMLLFGLYLVFGRFIYKQRKKY